MIRMSTERSLNTWIKAHRRFQTNAKSGQPPKSRIIFTDEGFVVYKWKKQETDGVHPPFAPLVVMEAQDGYQKNRGKDPRTDQTYHAVCGQDAPQGRAPRGNMARELSKAISLRARQRQWYEGSVPVVTDENSQLSTLAHRCLKRRSNRRRSVSEPEPPRSKRVSELAASLIRALRGSTCFL